MWETKSSSTETLQKSPGVAKARECHRERLDSACAANESKKRKLTRTGAA